MTPSKINLVTLTTIQLYPLHWMLPLLGVDAEGQLESEVESLRTQLHEMKQKERETETRYREMENHFENNLRELQEKATTLSSALDRESETKKTALKDLADVEFKLNKITAQCHELEKNASKQEKVLIQQLDEATRNTAAREQEIKKAQ